jgi:hypothetical protein
MHTTVPRYNVLTYIPSPMNTQSHAPQTVDIDCDTD